MRGKRSKQYRKLMQQYGLTFGFREPYQVLLDARMLKDVHRFKMDLVGQLARTLHGQVKPMITQCSIRHIYSLPVSNTPSDSSVTSEAKTAILNLSRTLELRRCSHHTLPSALSTLECISSVVDPSRSGANKHRLVLAVQDEPTRSWARAVRGVPSVYVKRSVMVMEPLAGVSEREILGIERRKLRGGAKVDFTVTQWTSGEKEEQDQHSGDYDDDEDKGGSIEGEPAVNQPRDGDFRELQPVKRKKKPKGPKEPNPLSVKRKRRYEGNDALKTKASQFALGSASKQISDGPLASGRPRKRKRKSNSAKLGDPL